VYRADLPRTFALVAVLLLTAASTSVFARESRAAELNRTDATQRDTVSAALIDRVRKVE
jgi:hypothetical protein